MATNDHVHALVRAALSRNWQHAKQVTQQILAHERQKNERGAMVYQIERLLGEAERQGMGDEDVQLVKMLPKGRDGSGDLVERRSTLRSLADLHLEPEARAITKGWFDDAR